MNRAEVEARIAERITARVHARLALGPARYSPPVSIELSDDYINWAIDTMIALQASRILSESQRDTLVDEEEAESRLGPGLAKSLGARTVAK